MRVTGLAKLLLTKCLLKLDPFYVSWKIFYIELIIYFLSVFSLSPAHTQTINQLVTKSVTVIKSSYLSYDYVTEAKERNKCINEETKIFAVPAIYTPSTTQRGIDEAEVRCTERCNETKEKVSVVETVLCNEQVM